MLQNAFNIHFFPGLSKTHTERCQQTSYRCVFKIESGAEFLDKIQTKDLRIFLIAIHSHLNSFALRFLFFQTHATSNSFYSVLLYTVK